jgi:hypothetical protein
VSHDAEQAGTTAFPSLGRYQPVARLGAGGMGEVWLARDTRLDRAVAVKLLPAHAVNDPDAVGRFRREAKALAKLSHPGIVQAHDSEEDAGRHFLVMEYVEGQSLAALLKEKGRVAPPHAADYLHQAALALQHAHERGLVHRDLKPSNLLVTPDGRVKVLDLGLARFLQDQIADPARTREGTGMGTPDYAAPEQFKDARTADARSDVYSLGCTLYRLLTGRVPFPGSSLSEKCEAHATKEPPPVEELCPEVPGGLALAVQKMMAKRPADRFQSAAEVAEALAPFVAGSSASFRHIRNTSSWQAGRLTLRELRPRRRWLGWVAAGAALAALLLVVGLTFGPRWFGRGQPADEGEPVAEHKGPGKPGDGTSPSPKKDDVGKPSKGPSPAAPARDPDVLTVSKSKEGGGEYRTLREALGRVRRGQTIRVLDDGVYRESVALNVPARHEGITLEATRGAVLETTTPTNLVEVDGVAQATIRGFRLRATDVRILGRGAVLVTVRGDCPGLLLEGLTGETNQKGCYVGVVITGTRTFRTEQPPAVVRNCVFRDAMNGIQVGKPIEDPTSPLPAGHVVIRGNLILSPSGVGIKLENDVRDVHVVGNRVWDAGQVGLFLENLVAKTRGILLANNTVVKCQVACALLAEAPEGTDIQVRNNLFLSEGRDLLFVKAADGPGKPPRPQDGKALHKAWRMDHNWRVGDRPARNDPFFRGWVPPTAGDVLRPAIEDIDRDPADLDTFLRPAKKSPLATKGAGQTDPWLPSYVGALPPEGVEPWDWDRTWRAKAPGRHLLLTVSKEGGGGKYRSIIAALKDARPWATIRVLDAETYAESLVLDDPEKQRGLTLEAPKHATIEMGPDDGRALRLNGVADVRVAGFRLRANKVRLGSNVVSVSGRVPGAVLEGLDIRSDMVVVAITLTNVSAGGREPLVVRGCEVHNRGEGILVDGPPAAGPGKEPVGGVALWGNHVSNKAYRGIVLQGALRRVLVAGNLVHNCGHADLQVQDLGPDAGQILFANNTAFNSPFPWRVWLTGEGETPPPGQVTLAGNLFFEADAADMGCLLMKPGEPAAQPGPIKALAAAWHFRRNARDLSGPRGDFRFPLAPGDRELKGLPLVWRDPASPDYLRPRADSLLAKEGPGVDDPSLPPYVGAVPPKGVKPWDWERTWRSRMARTPGEARKEKPDGAAHTRPGRDRP